GGERDKARQHRVDARSVSEHGLGDAGELGDEAGQTASGMDELGELADDATAVDAHGPDLDDAVTAGRRAAGGFEVDDHKRGLVDATRERRVCGGDPTAGRMMKREAPVAGEQRADEARAKL